MLLLWLYDIPSWLFALLIVLLWTTLAVGGMMITRPAVMRLHGASGERNDIVGFFLGAVSVFYGISLGLIAIASWERYNEVDSRVSEEAATVGALRSDVRSLPDSTALRAYMDSYLEFVIHCAWPAQAEGTLSNQVIPVSHADTTLRLDSAFIRPFRQMLNGFTTTDLGQANVQAEAMRRFNDLLRLRRLRLASVSQGMSSIVWWVVLLGGVLNIAITWLFVITPRRMHTMLNALIAAMIGLLIFLVAALDQPFRGSLRVRPEAFEQIHRKDSPKSGGSNPWRGLNEDEKSCHELFPNWVH